jgi:signal transduction histidine kinase
VAGGAAAGGAALLLFWPVYRLQQDSVRRMHELEQSRANLVEDSAARLRRIERDLHDGAQAQMVGVAMKLGLAREKLGGAIDNGLEHELRRSGGMPQLIGGTLAAPWRLVTTMLAWL